MEKKTSIMQTILSEWNENLVIVRYQYKQEVWKKDNANTVNLLDRWDLNTPSLQTEQRTLQTTNVHPWFFYLGFSETFDYDLNNFNLNLNSRIGFFLLNNRWDLAVFCTGGMDADSIRTSLLLHTGIMSKVYFPIKKLKISPYIGAGISHITTCIYNDSGDYGDKYFVNISNSWDIPVYTGISWFVGPGSFDVGFQFGKNFTTMIGYTFSPRFKK